MSGRARPLDHHPPFYSSPLGRGAARTAHHTCLPGLTSVLCCPNSPSCLPGLNGTYSLSIFVDEAKRIIDQHDTRHVKTCLTETRASPDMQPVAMASLPDECEPPVFSIIACPT